MKRKRILNLYGYKILYEDWYSLLTVDRYIFLSLNSLIYKSPICDIRACVCVCVCVFCIYIYTYQDYKCFEILYDNVEVGLGFSSNV